MTEQKYLQLLSDKSSFSRVELQDAMKKSGMIIGEASFKKKLQELLKQQKIIRVGRNAYQVTRNHLAHYQFDYSDFVEDLSDKIKNLFPYLDYSIFELRQLNEFLNHQIVHNIVFLSVEKDVTSFVFDALKEYFKGQILLSPTRELLDYYWTDNLIVINKRVTESPKGSGEEWHARIEKILVDMMADPIIQDSISVSEVSEVYEDIFKRYIVDESCLFRYARRRGADKEIREFITTKTDIQLHTAG